jgi:GNAT superfamily N-acetyltransferase
MSDRPEVEIRLATPAQADAIASVLLAAFGEFRAEYTEGAFEYTTPSADVIRGRFGEGPIWVAVREGRIIGTVSGLPEVERFYIRSMAIDPAAQRGGIGKTLLETLEAFAVAEGFKKLYLYTTYVLPGARHLYERNGFYVLRETLPEEWFDMGGFEMEKKI